MRAPRFPLNLSVRYRPLGAEEWCVGRTENISRSGVLVRTANGIDIDTSVEIRLELPTVTAGKDSAEIWCRGRVVRTVCQTDGSMQPGYAIAIEQYDFMPAVAEIFVQH
jgi:c-di-GMP-binding flagellar brake protein YcgR